MAPGSHLQRRATPPPPTSGDAPRRRPPTSDDAPRPRPPTSGGPPCSPPPTSGDAPWLHLRRGAHRGRAERRQQPPPPRHAPPCRTTATSVALGSQLHAFRSKKKRGSCLAAHCIYMTGWETQAVSINFAGI